MSDLEKAQRAFDAFVSMYSLSIPVVNYINALEAANAELRTALRMANVVKDANETLQKEMTELQKENERLRRQETCDCGRPYSVRHICNICDNDE